MADGSARKHDIQISQQHMQEWDERMKNKWECHIGQQDIDTFFVTVTVVTSGAHNWIRSYLLKWLGNFLFLSAMSSLANPHIAMEECSTFNVNYEKDAKPKTKVGERKALKVVGPGGRRLKAMAQLVSNNRGSINTYTLGENRVNFEKDPEAELKKTPVLVTAHTVPQFPGNSESFKCSGMVKNNINTPLKVKHMLFIISSFRMQC